MYVFLLLFQIILTDSGEIVKGLCKCPRGKVRCHHMAALLLHAHHNLSITDKECSWSNKQAKKKLEVKSVAELFPSKPYKAIQTRSVDVKKDLYKNLKENNETVGFAWLLSPEPLTEKNIISVPSMEDFFFSKEFKNSENKREFLEENCQLTLQEIETVASETIGQSLNWKWTKLRKFRITSSNFGLVLKTMKRNKFP